MPVQMTEDHVERLALVAVQARRGLAGPQGCGEVFQRLFHLLQFGGRLLWSGETIRTIGGRGQAIQTQNGAQPIEEPAAGLQAAGQLAEGHLSPGRGEGVVQPIKGDRHLAITAG